MPVHISPHPIQPVPESVVQPVPEPVVQPVPEPVVQPTPKSVALSHLPDDTSLPIQVPVSTNSVRFTGPAGHKVILFCNTATLPVVVINETQGILSVAACNSVNKALLGIGATAKVDGSKDVLGMSLLSGEGLVMRN
jgi:hypothetical protein